MQEGRIFPDDYRKVQIKSVIPISVSIVILVTTYMAITLWSSDHPEILQWSPYVLLTILLVLVFVTAYWRVRALRSRARFVRPEKTYYEGWAVDGLVPIIVVLALFLGLTTLRGYISRLAQGEHEDLIGLVMWSTFLAIIFNIFVVVYRSRLSVEEKGLVWRESAFRSIPPRYIPFDDLRSLRVEGRILSFRGCKGYPRGWLIVQNPKSLRSAIRRLWRQE